VPPAKGGTRKLTVSDEAALNGILFVLQTGIPWEDLPQSLRYGSGMTCWRRLRDWEGQETGPNTTDRGKLGSKRHIVVDARGIPLVILVSGANRHDSKMFEKCVDAIPTIAGLPRRPRKRPAKLHAEKGYDLK